MTDPDTIKSFIELLEPIPTAPPSLNGCADSETTVNRDTLLFVQAILSFYRQHSREMSPNDLKHNAFADRAANIANMHIMTMNQSVNDKNRNHVQGSGPSPTAPDNLYSAYAIHADHAVIAVRTDCGDQSDQSEVPMFRCPLSGCTKVFKQKVNLKRHINKHLNNGQFSCPECHKRFVYKCDLAVHARSHSGSKPFCCAHCKKQFNQRRDLSRHLKSHQNELAATESTEHSQCCHGLKVHRGRERPYECSKCSQTFKSNNRCLEHIAKCKLY